MRSRLEWFDSGDGNEALDLGIIGTDMFMKYIRYRIYLEELPRQKSRRQAILKAAERNKCDESTIREAIDFFE